MKTWRCGRVEVGWRNYADLHPAPMAGYTRIPVQEPPWWRRYVWALSYLHCWFAGVYFGIGCVTVSVRKKGPRPADVYVQPIVISGLEERKP